METKDDPNVKRKRIRELEVMVADAIPETPDSTTLILFTGNDRLEYLPGHFLTIDPHEFPQIQRFCDFLQDQKGKRELPRAYSLASAPHEKYLAITVKEEKYVSGQTAYPPLLSPLLVHRLARGTRLNITGFTGPYVLPADIETQTEHLVHVCAGSGIVPNFSILKHCLANQPKLKHTLIYSNKTWADVIFRRQLSELEQQHSDKLRVVHTLTREPDAAAHGPNVRAGRIDVELIRELIPAPDEVRVFCCGPGVSKYEREAARAKGVDPPQRFLEASLAALAAAGINSDQIHRESYG